MDIQALKNSINRGVLATVYLFYGQEEYLLRQTVNLVKDKLIVGEMKDFNMDIIDARTVSIEDMLNAANTLPFMADKRLVVIENCDFFKSTKGDQKLSKEDEELLISYLENPSTSSCVIFICHDGVDTRKKIYKQIVKHGQVIDFTPLKGTELVNWVVNKFRQEGKTITNDGVSLLVNSVGENMNLLNEEINKLVCYKENESQITAEDVAMLVAKSVEASVFKLVDDVMDKKYNQVMEQVRELIFYGESPVKILALLARQYRIALQAASMSCKGYNEKQISSEMGVQPWLARKALKQGKNIGEQRLKEGLLHIQNADYGIKTGRQEPMMALEQALLYLCK